MTKSIETDLEFKESDFYAEEDILPTSTLKDVIYLKVSPIRYVSEKLDKIIYYILS
jgi:hypothetical protein